LTYVITRAGERATMTFLFTDIEGSTRLWDREPDRAPALIEQHDRLVEQAVEAHGGRIFHRAGDGMIARFDDVAAAVRAAIDAQHALADATWVDVDPVRVRMGVHTGGVVVRPEGPYGWALNYGARLTDIGHGGQIVLSQAAFDGFEPGDEAGVSVRDLGAQRLRDIAEPAPAYQVVAADLRDEFPTPRGSVPVRSPRPEPRTSFVGRADVVEAILAGLEAARCTTITGASGIGKTRVAIEAAARLDRRSGAPTILWSDLGGVESDAIGASVMTAHSISQRPGRSAVESLVDWLSGEHVLLVLDRCDECLDGVAELVDAVIDGARSVTILCTSQRLLGLTGEVAQRLAPLDIDDAVELFIDRARAVGVDGLDCAEVAAVCERLDRMPFAIEIMAAGAAASTLGEMLVELELDGLSSVAADSEIAQSVEHAIAVGVDSLDPVDRDRLLAAAVLPGSFDRALFGAVCAPGADVASLSQTLRELVEASLVQPEPTGGRAVFRVLDPVRTFAASEIDADAHSRASQRLRDVALELSDQIAVGLRGAEELRWLLTLERGFDTLRFVFDEALAAGDTETAARLSTDLWEWAFFRYNTEYFDWGRRLLATVTAHDDPRLSLVLGVVALGHWFRDEFDATFDRAGEALRLERDHDAPFSLPARLALINATVFAGANAPPADVFDEAAEFQRAHGEPFYRVNVEAQNAMMATWLGQHDVAERRALRCLKIARASGNPSSVAYALWVLGQAIEHDDPERAEHLLDDALQQARDVDNRWIVSLTQTGLASIRRRTTGPMAAAPLLSDLLEQLPRAGHWAQFWNAVQLSALVIADLGDHERAYQLAAAVEAAIVTFPLLPVDAAALDEIRSSVVGQRGSAWANRTASIASTWDLGMVADVARAGLDEALGPT